MTHGLERHEHRAEHDQQQQEAQREHRADEDRQPAPNHVGEVDRCSAVCPPTCTASPLPPTAPGMTSVAQVVHEVTRRLGPAVRSRGISVVERGRRRRVRLQRRSPTRRRVSRAARRRAAATAARRVRASSCRRRRGSARWRRARSRRRSGRRPGASCSTSGRCSRRRCRGAARTPAARRPRAAASPPTAMPTGRRCTNRAHRCHMRLACRCAWCGRRGSGRSVKPTKPSSAGSSVIAASTAIDDRERRADGEAVQEAQAHQEHAEHRDHHGEAGEDHGPARGVHRLDDRGLGRPVRCSAAR